MVIRPISTYAVSVQWPRVTFTPNRAKLSKLHRSALFGITAVMRMTLAAATEVLLGLSPLHLKLVSENRAEIYRFCCSSQWKPKSNRYRHAYMSHSMNTSYQWGLTK